MFEMIVPRKIFAGTISYRVIQNSIIYMFLLPVGYLLLAHSNRKQIRISLFISTIASSLKPQPGQVMLQL